MEVTELATRLAAGESLQLVDVREPEEIAIAALEGAILLPLSQFADWGPTIHSRLQADQAIVVFCHHGMRSAHMCQWLARNGFTQLQNLSGGIDAYSRLVDPTLPRY